MAFRNDEQVDLQDLLFDELSGRDFFRTVVFECPVDVSLNWRLTEREKAILVGGFGRPDAAPEDELARREGLPHRPRLLRVSQVAAGEPKPARRFAGS